MKSKGKLPILLSFYALSNGTTTLSFGQITYTSIRDLSFVEYSRRKTFRTLWDLYRTKPYSNAVIALVFTKGRIETKTNRHGAFYVHADKNQIQGKLEKVLVQTGEEVRMVTGLYSTPVHYIEGDTMIVSDIDDTLLHSFIPEKLLKFRTLMFTTMEKRKAVTQMQQLLRKFTRDGAVPVYLSNSEQNLYPLIYRFLKHNKFPRGPIFLKQMRRLWDVVRNVKLPARNTHKVAMLEEMLTMFPEKKFILMGDNTQHDLAIYLSAAEKYPARIQYIIIRKVVEKKSDAALIARSRQMLKGKDIAFYYANEFPA